MDTRLVEDVQQLRVVAQLGVAVVQAVGHRRAGAVAAARAAVAVVLRHLDGRPAPAGVATRCRGVGHGRSTCAAAAAAAATAAAAAATAAATAAAAAAVAATPATCAVGSDRAAAARVRTGHRNASRVLRRYPNPNLIDAQFHFDLNLSRLMALNSSVQPISTNNGLLLQRGSIWKKKRADSGCTTAN